MICSSKISPDLYLEDGEEKLFGYSGYMNFIPLIPDSKVAVIRDKEGFFAFIKRDDATDELISRAEETMGYKLPESYKELLRFRNGGSVNGDLEECWLTEIYGIAADPDNFNGLEAMYDNWKNEWEYPDIGIPFGETASAGHDMY